MKVVAGDGFFSQKMIVEFGYINARCISDWYHLFNSGLEENFGKVCNQWLKSHLVALIKAESEDQFKHILSSAFGILHSMVKKDADWELKLQRFADLRVTYSQYCLNKMPGS